MNEITPTPMRITCVEDGCIHGDFEGLEDPNSRIALIHGTTPNNILLTVDDDTYRVKNINFNHLDMMNQDDCDIEIELVSKLP